MPSSKKWYTSKTIWTNLALLVIGIADALTGTNAIPANVLVIVAAVANGVLRFTTDKSLEPVL